MQSQLCAQAQVDPAPRANAANAASAGTLVVTPHQVRELTQLLIHSGIDRSLAYVDAVRAAGVSSEQVMMELLSPASEWLGDLWCEDRACFAEVTTALWRLQELLNHISPDFQRNARPPHGARILLCAAPGEAHVFGMKVLAEFLRRDGWDVRDEPMSNVHELLGAVRHEWYDVIGFSLACDNGIERLVSAVREVRAQSRNRDVKVMVGGAAFNTRPDWVALTGADATATSAQQAVLHARRLLGLIEGDYTAHSVLGVAAAASA
jgi:methanogenic corrinoid protein MtbC1